jgi:predicted RNA-binding protein YlxR (DUF448 family)
LVRVASTPHGVRVGRTAPGRGAWLCGSDCLDRSLRRSALARALRTTIDEASLAALRESFSRTAARMTESSTGDDTATSTPTKG